MMVLCCRLRRLPEGIIRVPDPSADLLPISSRDALQSYRENATAGYSSGSATGVTCKFLARSDESLIHGFSSAVPARQRRLKMYSAAGFRYDLRSMNE